MRWRERSLWTWAKRAAVVAAGFGIGVGILRMLDTPPNEALPLDFLHEAAAKKLDEADTTGIAQVYDKVMDRANVVDRVFNTTTAKAQDALISRFVPPVVPPKEVVSVTMATIEVPAPPPGDSTTAVTVSVTETTAGKLLVKLGDLAGNPIAGVSIVPESVVRVTLQPQGWQFSPGGSFALCYNGNIRPALVGAVMLYRWRMFHAGVAFDGRPGLMVAVDPGWHLRIGVYGTREAFGVSVGFGI